MKIRKIKSDDQERILNFLNEYPYKDMQRRAQGLDKERLADFHCKKIVAQAEKNESRIGISPRGEVVGIAIINPRPWHSSVFDIPMVKVSPFLLVHPDRNLKKKFIEEIIATIDKKKFKHTELRVDVNEWETVALLEDVDFHFVDCSLKLFMNLETGRLTLPTLPDKKYHITTCQESHHAKMMEIARSAHRYNHFFSDSSLDREKVSRLFSEWVEKCCKNLVSLVYVAVRGEEVMGFATILVNKEFNRALRRRIAVLDFIAVNPGFQGKGIGRWLLMEVLIRLRRDEEFEQVELRTSINNYPALNLYNTSGFHLIGVDTILTRKT